MSTFTDSSEARDRDDLASYFDRSAYVVHSYADRFEHTYARPAVKTATDLFNEHPVPFVFFCFFAALSVFPILLFLFCSVMITLSFVFFALSSALLASASFVFTFACILLLVLMTNVFIAIFPTVTIFWTYTILRLVSLTRSRGRAGAAKWVDETKSFVGKGLGVKLSPRKKENEPTSGSDASIVMVNGNADEKEEKHSCVPNGVKTET